MKMNPGLDTSNIGLHSDDDDDSTDYELKDYQSWECGTCSFRNDQGYEIDGERLNAKCLACNVWANKLLGNEHNHNGYQQHLDPELLKFCKQQ